MMTNWDKHYARRMNRMQGSEIREMMKILDRPGIISFAGGIPDPKYFPTAEIAAACQNILSDPKRSTAAQQYAVSEGYTPLRTWLAEQMTARGVPCTTDNVLITNGSQQALDFIAKLMVTPGDTILVGWPTYLGAVQAFNAYEPTYDHLPLPGSNRTPESYTADGKAAPKFAYVMTEFQNPTGTTMTLDERMTFLETAKAMDLPIIEDCAYERLRYDGAPLPSLLALAAKRDGGIDNCKVLYCGTFSKSIIPALRVGWIIAAKDVIGKLVILKQAADLHSSPFNQMIALDVASAIIEPHTAKVRAVYKERRDAMLKALETHMPAGISWTKPEGGMFVWMTLPAHMDSSAILQRAIAEENIAYVPGVAFHPDRSGRNTLRLNFSLNDPATIEEGIKRLGNLLRRV